MKVEIYTLKTCDSCRKATKWLRENGFTFDEIPIRDRPPARPDLELALASLDSEIRKLFNISGQDYRSLNLKEKLPALSTDEALDLLASNGNLIKRPFLKSADTFMVGFKEEIWSNALLD